MLETLLKILSWDLQSPTIMLEEDGDLSLEFFADRPGICVDISIAPSGTIAWAAMLGNEPSQHGTDIEQVKAILQKIQGEK